MNEDLILLFLAAIGVGYCCFVIKVIRLNRRGNWPMPLPPGREHSAKTRGSEAEQMERWFNRQW